MTLTQFVDFVRNRHNASGDSNWSDTEIYALITARANEVLSIIGMIEATNTSTTTVASTQAYSIPSDAVALRAVLYNGERLQRISFREWELEKSSGTTPTGTPRKFVIWNDQVLLVPTPDAAQTITFYYTKEHAYIDNSSQTTIDIPSVLHSRLANGVIADMYAKDLNFNGAQYYEGKWNQVDIPALYKYANKKRRSGRLGIVADSDTLIGTDLGVT